MSVTTRIGRYLKAWRIWDDCSRLYDGMRGAGKAGLLFSVSCGSPAILDRAWQGHSFSWQVDLDRASILLKIPEQGHLATIIEPMCSHGEAKSVSKAWFSVLSANLA